MTESSKVPAVRAFDFNGSRIEVQVDEKGVEWFNAAEICTYLVYKNASKAIKDHCKQSGLTKRYTSSSGQGRLVNFINEPNLYRLIGRSKLPAAEAFESWVMETVLPSIRRTGSYGTQKARQEAPVPRAKDVLSCLGYSVKSYSNAIKKNCREKGVAKRKTLSVVPVHKTDSKCSVVRNQEHEANFIDEPNLYRLVMVSKKAEAESFQDWVTEIVLPSIRRTGSYGTQKARQEAPVPRAKDDSLAYLNKKLNSTYTRAYWVKHGRAPDVEEYRRLATFINSLALGTKEIEQRQVMTDTGAIRVTNLLIMLIRGFENGSIDTQQTRNTYIKLYGQSTAFLTLVDRDSIKQLSA